jgi:hypothetical protein
MIFLVDTAVEPLRRATKVYQNPVCVAERQKVVNRKRTGILSWSPPTLANVFLLDGGLDMHKAEAS